MILFVIFNSFDEFYLFIFINLNDLQFYFSFILLSTDHMNLKYKVATIQYIFNETNLMKININY